MIENNSLDVSKEIDDFFEDYESSKKRLKLLFRFKSSSFDFNTKDIEIDTPKKKKVFKAKVKKFKKNNNTKNIF